MKKIRIYKIKVMLFLTLILVFNLGLVILTEDNFDISSNDTQSSIEVYTVKSGDTFWSIAENYNYTNKMGFVSDIERINKINSEKLKPGYKLAIPIYKNK